MTLEFNLKILEKIDNYFSSIISKPELIFYTLTCPKKFNLDVGLYLGQLEQLGQLEILIFLCVTSRLCGFIFLPQGSRRTREARKGRNQQKLSIEI